MALPLLIPAAAAGAGYIYGAFAEKEGVTTTKVIFVSLAAAAVYFIIKKAGK